VSIWELREAFESAIPAWVSVVAVVFSVVLIIWARFVRKGPNR
jgi:hypothetical protein